jgi:membrane protease YdiL (CAAX protease family)
MSESKPADAGRVSLDSSAPASAAVAIAAWVLVEFVFRRGLAPALTDALGTGLGADMVSIAVGFPLLAAGIALLGRRTGIRRPDWDYATSIRAVGAGVAGFVGYVVLFSAAATVYTSVLGLEPSIGVAALGVGAAPTWALGLLFVVNGILVPITEELAWRGVIQTALADAYGTWLAVLVTAAAFVAKHLVVDLAAPLFRVTSLVIMATIFCGLRARYGTTSSTVAHLLANGVFTGLVFL